MLPIVLTGTIIPNSAEVRRCDWTVRRQDYLTAIRYYRQFVPKLYFIENSGYDFSRDSDFAFSSVCRVVVYPKSSNYGRGKGFQEFEMLDQFVARELEEDAFLKITGRYIYKNIAALYASVQSRAHPLVIDALKLQKIALTRLFYATKAAYGSHLQGLYKEMDDSSRNYAEDIVYRHLRKINSACFSTTPILHVVSGSTGTLMMTNENVIKLGVKNMQRALSRALGVGWLIK